VLLDQFEHGQERDHNLQSRARAPQQVLEVHPAAPSQGFEDQTDLVADVDAWRGDRIGQLRFDPHRRQHLLQRPAQVVRADAAQVQMRFSPRRRCQTGIGVQAGVQAIADESRRLLELAIENQLPCQGVAGILFSRFALRRPWQQRLRLDLKQPGRHDQERGQVTQIALGYLA
jgi:hypothetical protein